MSGRTPWEAASDPNLPFNLMVMRTARAERMWRFQRTATQLKHSEQATTTLLAMIFEEQ